MNDILMTIYNQLITNSVITNAVDKRIKFYEVPETMTVPFILIRPVDVPYGVLSGSDQELSVRLTYQIEVESDKRMDVKQIQVAIKEEMKNLGFGQLNEGLDTYFNETKHFVDARRYRKNTTLNDVDY